jgi:hypothetical protein
MYKKIHVPCEVSTPTEWNSLKHQFDALVHDESVDVDTIEKTFDEQVRRRFAEMISRAADRKSGTRAFPPEREVF